MLPVQYRAIKQKLGDKDFITVTRPETGELLVLYMIEEYRRAIFGVDDDGTLYHDYIEGSSSRTGGVFNSFFTCFMEHSEIDRFC